MNKEPMEQTKQMPSGRLKSNHIENYTNCKCFVLPLKDTSEQKEEKTITIYKKHTLNIRHRQVENKMRKYT